MTNILIPIKRTLAVVLCATLATSGCATARMAPPATPGTTGDRLADRAVLAEYVQRLAPGSAVKVERSHRRTLRATLMKATNTHIVVQPRTRIPEPAIEIPLDEVLSVTLDVHNGSSVGKAIGAGVAAGAGVVLGLFLISLALWSD